MEKPQPKSHPAKLGKGDIPRIILSAIGMVGLVSLAVAAPNAIQLLKYFKPGQRRYQSKRYVNELISRLEERGWIYMQKKGGRSFARITKKGELELRKYQTKEKLLKKAKWDGKWRVVIFDVREEKKGLRERIRSDIKAFGFIRLQDSVWVYPYDCEDLITLLKASCRIGKEVLYLIVEKIENDRWLRREFNLATM
ncbi:MAG: hypothetical protein Q8Q10_00525 [bacterium]|nr:hypothetical protein [bacterium]